MSIVINGTGSISGLAVGGLPDGTVDSGTIATGTIVDADVANVAASKLTGALPAISGASLTNLPAGGKVLQVVQTVKTDTFSTSTTGSYVDVTGMSVSITPSSTSNKVLIILSSNHSAISTGWAQGQLALSDNTQLMTTFARAESGLIAFPFTHVYLHSPSSTSAVTYKMRLKAEAGTTYVNRPSIAGSFVLQSSITALEIGG